jgi:hypothetical protein
VPAAYVLARKLDPGELAVPTTPMAELELPSPGRVPFQSLLAWSGVPSVKVSRLFRESAAALGVAPTVADKLGALLENWPATTNSLYPEQLHALLEPTLKEARRLLNDDSLYARYLAALDAGMAELVLSHPMPMF